MMDVELQFPEGLKNNEVTEAQVVIIDHRGVDFVYSRNAKDSSLADSYPVIHEITVALVPDVKLSEFFIRSLKKALPSPAKERCA